MMNKNGSLASIRNGDVQLWPGGYITGGPNENNEESMKIRQELADAYMRSELRNGRALKDVEALVRSNFPDLQSIQAVYDLEGNLEPQMVWHKNMDAAVKSNARKTLREKYGMNPTEKEVEDYLRQTEGY